MEDPFQRGLWSAVEVLLDRMPRTGDRARVRHLCSVSSSLADLAGRLTDAGLTARAYRLGAADLPYLGHPAVVRLARGHVAITGRGLLGFTALAGGSTTRLTCARLRAELATEALELVVAPPEPRSIRRFLAQAVEVRAREIGVLVSLVFLSNLAFVLPALVVREAIDVALPTGARQMLRLLAIGAALLGIYQAFVMMVRDLFLRAVTVRAESTLRRWLLDHILRLPFRVHQGQGYALFSQALGSLAHINQGLITSVLPLSMDVVLIATSLGSLALVMPALGAVLAAVAAATLTFAFFNARKQIQWHGLEVTAQTEQLQALHEVLYGAETLKMMGRETEGVEHWRRAFLRERRARLERQNVGNWSDTVAQAVPALFYLAAIIWGARLAMAGRVSTGDLMAGAQLAVVAAAAVGRVGAGLSLGLGFFRTFAPRVHQVLRIPAQSPRARSDARASANPLISMEGVWFRYDPEGRWTIQNRSLTVAPGQHLHLAGRSGSGKTTLLRLVAGLLEPERGTVLVNGGDVRSSRHLVAYLPQRARLIQGSIQENLALFSGGADRRAILEAAERTGLAEVVGTMAMGYETLLPPGGHCLSGGERQLVMITACLASGRPILLLDEALAHLDLGTQARLFERDLFRDRTVLFVDHDWMDRPGPTGRRAAAPDEAGGAAE
jgi:ABC-type bacteriocin/lantibiotic exporter with double-glycine peptidase domain